MNKDQINPELRTVFSRLPPIRFDWWWLLKLIRFLERFLRGVESAEGVLIEDRQLQHAGVRIYSPEANPSGAALLWIHGGGMITGTNVMNDRECIQYARNLGLVVVSVEYRRAPEFPFPAPLDDCYEAWQWLQASAEKLGVDPARIIISGQSAGGGLSASLTQRILDLGGTQPAGQALFCPMLDDRTAARVELDSIKHKLWNNQSNRAGWRHYLGHAPGQDETRDHAVPARRSDLSGLPPAWIGIGDVDLFFAEAQIYRDRLRDSGVPCDFYTVPGGYHGFEAVSPEAEVTRAMMDSNDIFMRRVLGL